jgi:hypothetical protein
MVRPPVAPGSGAGNCVLLVALPKFGPGTNPVASPSASVGLFGSAPPSCSQAICFWLSSRLNTSSFAQGWRPPEYGHGIVDRQVHDAVAVERLRTTRP